MFVKTAEDKIYELDLDNEEDKRFYYHYNNNPFLEDYEENGRIIAEAQTIEELFDEIVIDCKSNINKKPFIHILPPKVYVTKTRVDYISEQDTSVYGAIWTDKGLIYVAKMNSNNEFEIIE